MNADLRAGLLRRVAPGQEARRARDMVAAQRADADNLPWLRQVIAEHGWPGRSDVGDDGSQAAFLLVQHADADPVFQRECLGLLTAAVSQGEASRQHLALLTDRVLVAEGQPQEYGTQLEARGGEWAPLPIRDPDGVDARRAEMSLPPLAEYVAMVTGDQGPPPETVVISLACPRCQHAIEAELADPGGEADVTCPGCGLGFRIAPAGDDDGDPGAGAGPPGGATP
jgi:hypothetical protein